MGQTPSSHSGDPWRWTITPANGTAPESRNCSSLRINIAANHEVQVSNSPSSRIVKLDSLVTCYLLNMASPRSGFVTTRQVLRLAPYTCYNSYERRTYMFGGLWDTISSRCMRSGEVLRFERGRGISVLALEHSQLHPDLH